MTDHPAVRIGMLTPPSNPAVEPIVAAMLADLPEVSTHASRIRVTEISLKDGSRNQFQPETMLAAADLLTGARGLIFVTDQTPSLMLLSPGGERLGRCKPVDEGAHGVAINAAGDVFLSELTPPRITKLTRLG